MKHDGWIRCSQYPVTAHTVLSQMSQVHLLKLLSLRSILILPLSLLLCHPSSLFRRHLCTRLSHHSWVILITFGEAYKWCKVLAYVIFTTSLLVSVSSSEPYSHTSARTHTHTHLIHMRRKVVTMVMMPLCYDAVYPGKWLHTLLLIFVLRNVGNRKLHYMVWQPTRWQSDAQVLSLYTTRDQVWHHRYVYPQVKLVSGLSGYVIALSRIEPPTLVPMRIYCRLKVNLNNNFNSINIVRDSKVCINHFGKSTECVFRFGHSELTVQWNCSRQIPELELVKCESVSKTLANSEVIMQLQPLHHHFLPL